MKYQAYIFDFDYTLADATNGIVACFDHAFEQLGREKPNRADVIDTIGMSLPIAFETLVPNPNREEQQAFCELFTAKSSEIMVENTKLYDDTARVLHAFKESGCNTGIVTTKFHARISGVLERENLSDAVDVIIGGDEVTEHKPSPEGIFKALSLLNCDQNKVLYIGDSTVDAEAAKAAQVDFCAVTTGTVTKETFLSYPNQGIFPNLNAFLTAQQSGGEII